MVASVQARGCWHQWLTMVAAQLKVSGCVVKDERLKMKRWKHMIGAYVCARIMPCVQFWLDNYVSEGFRHDIIWLS